MAHLQLRFGQIDPAAKADISAITSSAGKAWTNLSDFKLDNIPLPGNYATLEHNFAVLTGDMEEFPDSTSGKTWGLWSNVMSGADGVFLSPPKLTMTFSANHKSQGLTLRFYPYTDDYASRVRTTWYNSGGAVISTDVFTLTSNIGVIANPVTDYRKIEYEFLSTNMPYRYIKLYAVDFGIIRTIDDHEISSLRVVEEVDPTGESLSINVMTAQIKTREPLISPITGGDEMMMKRQMLSLLKDGEPFGDFFLEGWTDVNQSGIIFDLSAEDAMSVMDLYTFMGGMYSNVLASEILTAIFSVAFPTGLIKYILDPVFSSKRLTGWLPICSCGTAFQHVCFALDAVADTARIGDIWIYPRDTETTLSVPLLRQYRTGSSIRPTDYYSGVDVVSHNFVAGTETITVQNGVLSVGQHTIRFSEPLHTLTATNGTIITAHANYAVINVPSQNTVTLTGRRYIDNQSVHSARGEVAAGEAESIKAYENYTLVAPSIGPALAASRYAFLQNRIRFESDVALDSLEVGYMAKAETKARSVTGTITSLDINARANKAKMVVIGSVDTSDNG